MAGFDFRTAVAGLLAVGLVGCGTTSAPVPQIPAGVTGGVAIGAGAPAPAATQQIPAAPASNQPVQQSPAMAAPPIGQTPPAMGASPAAAPGPGGQMTAPGASTLAGLWDLRNDAGETCQLNLSTTSMGSSFQASPSGACSMSFGTVAGWSEANGQLFLFDGRNTLLGRFFPNGLGGYSGTFGDGVISSSQATLRRL